MGQSAQKAIPLEHREEQARLTYLDSEKDKK